MWKLDNIPWGFSAGAKDNSKMLLKKRGGSVGAGLEKD